MVVLQRAVVKAQGGVSPDMGVLLAKKMNQYASLLASQGSLQTAISYLPTNTEQVIILLYGKCSLSCVEGQRNYCCF